MFEYKILKTKVREAEEEINRLADQGWRVISSDTINGASFTIDSTPFIVTLEREVRA